METGSWQQAQRVPCLRGYRCRFEGERDGRAAVPVVPLVAEVRAVRVTAFAQRDVLRCAVNVTPVYGESLRWAVDAVSLLHRRGIAAEGLGAGSGDAAYSRQKLGQRMLDVEYMPASVCPLSHVGGSFAVLHPSANSRGQQSVPVFVSRRKPG